MKAEIDPKAEEAWNHAMFAMSVLTCWRLLWIHAPDGWVVLFGLLPCVGVAYWFCTEVAGIK